MMLEQYLFTNPLLENPHEVEIVRAGDTLRPNKNCREAFALFRRVHDSCNADPLPVFLLDKPESAFGPQTTLLARTSRFGLAGVALLQKLPFAGEDMTPVARKFGELAVNKLAGLLPRPGQSPLYEIGSIAVESDATCRGVGRALYAGAAELTGGRVMATINVANPASRRAAEAAGFVMVDNSRHTVNFSVVEGRAVPNPQGRHVQEAELFMYDPAVVKNMHIDRPRRAHIVLPPEV